MGYAEIVKYSPLTKKAYVTASAMKSVVVMDMSNPKKPTIQSKLDLMKGVIKTGKITSVAISEKYVAASVRAKSAGKNGEVKLYDMSNNFVKSFEVGDLPDSIDFSADGRYIVVANEGEPSDDQMVNSGGSISIIDLKGRDCQYSIPRAVKTLSSDELMLHINEPYAEYHGNKLVSLSAINGCIFTTTKDDIKNATVMTLKITGDAPANTHIVNPNATFAQNAEPEYVTITKDSKYAFVSLQEVNAIAKVDLSAKKIISISGLGFKDVSDVEHDYSDKDGGIKWTKAPIKMMYQPDTIATLKIRGKNYIVGANEGDSQDYDGYSEERRVGALTLDGKKFPNANVLQDDKVLGRLKTTTAMGDIDGDGDIDEIYAFGGRSFSIWDESGRLLFDSGNDFEKIIANHSPTYFNANGSIDKADERSDDKGPEPEAITVGTIDDRHYAFIGMERNNAIFAYDITLPEQAKVVAYQAPLKNHKSIESLVFIRADESPNH